MGAVGKRSDSRFPEGEQSAGSQKASGRDRRATGQLGRGAPVSYTHLGSRDLLEQNQKMNRISPFRSAAYSTGLDGDILLDGRGNALVTTFRSMKSQQAERAGSQRDPRRKNNVYP